MSESYPTVGPPADRPHVRFLARPVKLFVEHPLTKLVVGLILVASGLVEAYDSLFEDLTHLRLRAHHGLLILGFVNVLASLPALIEGIEKGLAFFEARGPAVAESPPGDPGRS